MTPDLVIAQNAVQQITQMYNSYVSLLTTSPTTPQVQLNNQPHTGLGLSQTDPQIREASAGYLKVLGMMRDKATDAAQFSNMADLVPMHIELRQAVLKAYQDGTIDEEITRDGLLKSLAWTWSKMSRDLNAGTLEIGKYADLYGKYATMFNAPTPDYAGINKACTDTLGALPTNLTLHADLLSSRVVKTAEGTELPSYIPEWAAICQRVLTDDDYRLFFQGDNSYNKKLLDEGATPKQIQDWFLNVYALLCESKNQDNNTAARDEARELLSHLPAAARDRSLMATFTNLAANMAEEQPSNLTSAERNGLTFDAVILPQQGGALGLEVLIQGQHAAGALLTPEKFEEIKMLAGLPASANLTITQSGNGYRLEYGPVNDRKRVTLTNEQMACVLGAIGYTLQELNDPAINKAAMFRDAVLGIHTKTETKLGLVERVAQAPIDQGGLGPEAGQQTEKKNWFEKFMDVLKWIIMGLGLLGIFNQLLGLFKIDPILPGVLGRASTTYNLGAGIYDTYNNFEAKRREMAGYWDDPYNYHTKYGGGTTQPKDTGLPKPTPGDAADA